jgi:hypothetical protein
MNRWKNSLLFSAFLLPLLFMVVSCEKVEPVELAFFYMEVCPGCEAYQRAETLGGFVVTLGQTKEYTGEVWNLGHGDQKGSTHLFEILDKYELPDISYSLPLLFIGSDYYVGYEEIEEKLRSLLEDLNK